MQPTTHSRAIEPTMSMPKPTPNFWLRPFIRKSARKRSIESTPSPRTIPTSRLPVISASSQKSTKREARDFSHEAVSPVEGTLDGRIVRFRSHTSQRTSQGSLLSSSPKTRLLSARALFAEHGICRPPG